MFAAMLRVLGVLWEGVVPAMRAAAAAAAEAAVARRERRIVRFVIFGSAAQLCC